MSTAQVAVFKLDGSYYSAVEDSSPARVDLSMPPVSDGLTLARKR